MIPDPASQDHLPLGLAPTAKLGGPNGADAVAFTCASCHFARLADGRYAVGAPNHGYEYGRSILAIAVYPTVALSASRPTTIRGARGAPAAARKTAGDAALKTRLLVALAPLAGSAMMPPFPKEAEHHYATWRSGTMDFLIEPLPVNDGVHTVSKISALWGLPTDAAAAAGGMQGALLGWTGGTTTLLHFAEGFVQVGGGPSPDWPDEKLAPLVEYIYALRAPANPSPPTVRSSPAAARCSPRRAARPATAHRAGAANASTRLTRSAPTAR